MNTERTPLYADEGWWIFVVVLWIGFVRFGAELFGWWQFTLGYTWLLSEMLIIFVAFERGVMRFEELGIREGLWSGLQTRIFLDHFPRARVVDRC